MTTRRSSSEKPRLFIGSSVEGLEVAQQLEVQLEHDAECTRWDEGVFDLSLGGLESLIRKIPSFEFAVLSLTPDDMTIKRGVSANTARDNVLLELGLFMGFLGRERTFLLYCRDDLLELPTDLAGVTAVTYARRSDGNLRAALGPAATRIRDAMKQVLNTERARAGSSTPSQLWRPPAPVAQRLVPGCNNVTVLANETVQQVVARVTPISAVISIWKQVPGTSQYQVAAIGGNAPASVSNLSTLNALDAIFICVNAPATYRLAGIFDVEPAATDALPPQVSGTSPWPGAPGARVFGTAQISGQWAPAGTTILAVVGTTVCATGLVSGNSTYVIDVASAATHDGCGTDGATIYFYVGNIRANQTATWRQGAVFQVNLTASTDPQG